MSVGNGDTEKFEALCRLCLTELTGHQSKSLFGLNEDGVGGFTDLQILIRALIKIEILYHAKLPMEVCGNCYTWLVVLAKFKHNAVSHQEQLELLHGLTAHNKLDSIDDTERVCVDKLSLDISVDGISFEVPNLCFDFKLNDIQENQPLEGAAVLSNDVIDEVPFLKLEPDLTNEDGEQPIVNVEESNGEIRKPLRRKSAGSKKSRNIKVGEVGKIEIKTAEKLSRKREYSAQLKIPDKYKTSPQVSSTANVERFFTPEMLSQVECILQKQPFKDYAGEIEQILCLSEVSKYWKCSECQTLCFDYENFTQHWENCHSDMKITLPCDLCDAYVVSELYVRHWREHFYDLRCDVCNKAYASYKILRAHSKIHKRPGYSCELCGKVFGYNNSLKRHHLLFHNESQNHKTDKLKSICPTCGKTVTNFALHLKLIHNDAKPAYKCNVCLKPSKTKELHERHMLRHDQDRPKYTCEYCGIFILANNDSINRHMITAHGKEKEHECSVCSKKYASKSELNDHSKSHSKQFDFKCDLCSRQFQRQKYLDSHKLTHLEVIPFSCPICSRQIRMEANFRKHMKIHIKKGEFTGDVFTLVKQCREVWKQDEKLAQYNIR